MKKYGLISQSSWKLKSLSQLHTLQKCSIIYSQPPKDSISESRQTTLLILNFTPRHRTNHIEEKKEKEEIRQYWQIMNIGKSNGYYISLSVATDKMWQHEGEREESRERKKCGRRKKIIYLLLTIRNQDFEEIRMFFWFSITYLQKYKLKSISELIKKDWKIKRFSYV